MASKTKRGASGKMRRGDKAEHVVARDRAQEARDGVEALAEPDGDIRTYYAPVLDALAHRLDCWQMTGNTKVEDAREELRTGLLQLAEVATRLDALVESANAD